MAQNSVKTTRPFSIQNDVSSSLNELSISSIREKYTYDTSFDFSQEKNLLNQINTAAPNIDDYGLTKAPSASQFSKGRAFNETTFLEKPGFAVRPRNFQNQEQSLCFNKKLKRKRPASKSREKIQESCSLFLGCHSMKQLKVSGNMLVNKDASSEKININQIPPLEISSIAKVPSLSLKIYEAPFLQLQLKETSEKLKRTVYLFPDQFKDELNDLANWRIDRQYCDYGVPKQQSKLLQRCFDSRSRHQQRSIFSIDMKRSMQSRHEENNSVANGRLSGRRSEIGSRSGSKVIELCRPSALDSKNQSYFSSRTDEYESPISKQSVSTAECRAIKRKQSRNPDNSYGYSEPFTRSRLQR